MQQEWEDEKRRHDRDLKATHDGHNAIIKKIEESKDQVQKLESKIKEAERNKVYVDNELETLREDK